MDANPPSSESLLHPSDEPAAQADEATGQAAPAPQADWEAPPWLIPLLWGAIIGLGVIALVLPLTSPSSTAASTDGKRTPPRGAAGAALRHRTTTTTSTSSGTNPRSGLVGSSPFTPTSQANGLTRTCATCPQVTPAPTATGGGGTGITTTTVPSGPPASTVTTTVTGNSGPGTGNSGTGNSGTGNSGTGNSGSGPPLQVTCDSVPLAMANTDLGTNFTSWSTASATAHTVVCIGTPGTGFLMLFSSPVPATSCPKSYTAVGGIGITACLAGSHIQVYANTASIFIWKSGASAAQLKAFAHDVVKTIGG